MKKPRFNIIDFLIIVVIVAVIAAGVYILGNVSETEVNTKTAKVLITIEETEVDPAMVEYYKENAKEGSAVSMGIREKVGGTLKEVNIVATPKTHDNPVTGKKELVDEIDKYDLTFTIETEITETDKDFLIGTAKIKIGEELNFTGKGFSGYGKVVIIEKVGGEE